MLRAAIDQTGFRDDVSNTATGFADTWGSLTDDPFIAAIDMVDLQTLKDRPAKWWGTLTPDIVLAAGGGVGVATKAFRGVAAADELATAAAVGDGSAWHELAQVDRVVRAWPDAPQPGTHAYSLGYDHAIAKFRPGEYQTATRLIDQYGLDLVRATPEDAFDWIDPKTGTTYDAVGNFPGEFLERKWPHFQAVLRDHLEKADVVPVDVSQFSAAQIVMVKQFVEQFGDRVLIVGE